MEKHILDTYAWRELFPAVTDVSLINNLKLNKKWTRITIKQHI